MRNIQLFILLLCSINLIGQKSEVFIDPLDGQKYPIVQVVGHEVQARNLNSKFFRNGDTLARAVNDEQWQFYLEHHIPAWRYYNDDSTNASDYGKLYNLFAVVDPRGLAPVGWHIPTETEMKYFIQFIEEQDRWNYTYKVFFNGVAPKPEDSVDIFQLIMAYEDTLYEGFYKDQEKRWGFFSDEYVRDQPGSRLKSTKYWPEGDLGTNLTGFNAFPGGSFNLNEHFNGKGQYAYFWTSSTYDDFGVGYKLTYLNGDVLFIYNNLDDGFSVRCFKGEPESMTENDN